MAQAYIVAAVRTASGRRKGRLSGWHPADLAATTLDALVDRTGMDPALIDDVIMGCVGQAGEQALNIGRNAVLASRLPESVPGTTIDRQCGSSQQALHFAAQAVMSGTMDIVVAAGVESMTRVPMGTATDFLQQHGFGSFMSPGMQARYPGKRFSQFDGAELVAARYGLQKEAMDRFALASHQKAASATQAGLFSAEIVPVRITLENGESALHSTDEGIRYDASLASIEKVKLLTEGGTATAASTSQISDGAAALLVVNEAGLKKLNLAPLARIHHIGLLANDPVVMLETPVQATLASLAKAGMRIDDIDLFEVNEAFASIPLAWLKGTGADPARLNVNGGAIALGHPLGASGARLMTTLVHALHQQNKRYGLQTMCELGGLANVTIVERL
ncbi:acetyl-CoA C-acetyltransferase [Herbaspirillum sp. alder98]|uniref:acetyl-CoA C-acetyltransferase n=1 Tax=Herbaspirillum sp. alder98 TaxID=2913096 RepID=UPI001CD8DAA1|nr:acetyl-CoA C-acetyltransferase [Herbaspirillum sp. alder98]MCA1326069.1 acetyl-CoA C-acetyltransferase [Herbaspirillum sp. alder98]